MKKYKVYCLRDKQSNLVYIGATRNSLSKRFGRGYKTFDSTNFKIELIDSFDTENEMFELESKLIKHYGLDKLLNKCETTTTGARPKGYVCKSNFKKGENGDDRFGTKRKKASLDAVRRPVFCETNGITYSSLSEAARLLGLHLELIRKVANELRTHTGGYKFNFVNHTNTEGQ